MFNCLTKFHLLAFDKRGPGYSRHTDRELHRQESLKQLAEEQKFTLLLVLVMSLSVGLGTTADQENFKKVPGVSTDQK